MVFLVPIIPLRQLGVTGFELVHNLLKALNIQGFSFLCCISCCILLKSWLLWYNQLAKSGVPHRPDGLMVTSIKAGPGCTGAVFNLLDFYHTFYHKYVNRQYVQINLLLCSLPMDQEQNQYLPFLRVWQRTQNHCLRI